MSAGRKNIMLGTAGHVDHGKTALVKLLTGCDTDRLSEEKRRGLTIELGFAPCTMADDRIMGIVDVPGHVNFIRNMVAGAHGVDVVILVVAADDGVMPQTREHLDILTLMGTQRGVVALSKCDLVDSEMRDLAIETVRDVLGGTFLENKPICPLSNITGDGFDAFLSALRAEVDATEPHASDGPFRLWVERVFRIKGFGVVVSGIPTNGTVRVGQTLRILPGGASVRVRGLEVYGEPAEEARAGECVAINLADADPDTVDRGCVLCEGEAFAAVRNFEADLHLLPSAGGTLEDYTEVHLHIGTAERMANVAMLENRPIAPGECELVQLRLTEPLPTAPGERFVIRGSGAQGRLTTLGGGRVLDVTDLRLRRNRPWTLRRLGARREVLDDQAGWIGQILREADGLLAPAELARRCLLQEQAVHDILRDMIAQGQIVDAAGRYAHAENVSAIADRLVEALEQFHERYPLRLGAESGELALDPPILAELKALAVDRLVSQGRAERHGRTVALPGRGDGLTPPQRELLDSLRGRLRRAGLQPPTPRELTESLACDARELEGLLRRLCEAGEAVRLGEPLVMSAEAVAQARKVVLDLFAETGHFETTQFRDALGVSRKFAVPLLDYFDTTGLTVRSGSRRTPGKAVGDAGQQMS